MGWQCPISARYTFFTFAMLASVRPPKKTLTARPQMLSRWFYGSLKNIKCGLRMLWIVIKCLWMSYNVFKMMRFEDCSHDLSGLAFLEGGPPKREPHIQLRKHETVSSIMVYPKWLSGPCLKFVFLLGIGGSSPTCLTIFSLQVNTTYDYLMIHAS